MNAYRYVLEQPSGHDGWAVERWYNAETGELVATRFSTPRPQGQEVLGTIVPGTTS